MFLGASDDDGNDPSGTGVLERSRCLAAGGPGSENVINQEHGTASEVRVSAGAERTVHELGPLG
jgi:hypothetical protein